MTTPQDLLRNGADVYEEKNEDYGDSWKLAGRLLWQMADEAEITLETEEDFIRFGLWTRRMDKIIRAFNGEFVAEEMHFESIQDSHSDEMVYASMHGSLSENQTQ